MWETWVQSLGWEDPLEKGKATHSSILAWRNPWTVWSMGSQRVRHSWVTFPFLCKTCQATGESTPGLFFSNDYMRYSTMIMIMTPILQMRTLGLRDVHQLAQSHQRRHWKSQNSTKGCDVRSSSFFRAPVCLLLERGEMLKGLHKSPAVSRHLTLDHLMRKSRKQQSPALRVKASSDHQKKRKGFQGAHLTNLQANRHSQTWL